MIRIKLAGEDRDRYGLPEWIEYPEDRPKLSEIRRLKAEVDWTLSRLDDALRAEELDEQVAGKAVLWWLAVNRHHVVSWEDFDVDVLGAQWERDADPNWTAPVGASTVSTSSGRKSPASTASRTRRSKS